MTATILPEDVLAERRAHLASMPSTDQLDARQQKMTESQSGSGGYYTLEGTKWTHVWPTPATCGQQAEEFWENHLAFHDLYNNGEIFVVEKVQDPTIGWTTKNIGILNLDTFKIMPN